MMKELKVHPNPRPPNAAPPKAVYKWIVLTAALLFIMDQFGYHPRRFFLIANKASPLQPDKYPCLPQETLPRYSRHVPYATKPLMEELSEKDLTDVCVRKLQRRELHKKSLRALRFLRNIPLAWNGRRYDQSPSDLRFWFRQLDWYPKPESRTDCEVRALLTPTQIHNIELIIFVEESRGVKYVQPYRLGPVHYAINS